MPKTTIKNVQKEIDSLNKRVADLEAKLLALTTVTINKVQKPATTNSQQPTRKMPWLQSLIQSGKYKMALVQSGTFACADGVCATCGKKMPQVIEVETARSYTACTRCKKLS